MGVLSSREHETSRHKLWREDLLERPIEVRQNSDEGCPFNGTHDFNWDPMPAAKSLDQDSILGHPVKDGMPSKYPRVD